MHGRNVRLAVKVAEDGRAKYLIAAEAGINPSTFSGFLSGRGTPNLEQRSAIARVLDADEADLFGEVPA